jgi:hypothetical protein
MANATRTSAGTAANIPRRIHCLLTAEAGTAKVSQQIDTHHGLFPDN